MHQQYLPINACKAITIWQQGLLKPLRLRNVVPSKDARLHSSLTHHSGWRSTAEWEEARVWQIQAWNFALNKLQELTNTVKT